jgi:hypothetical protein
VLADHPLTGTWEQEPNRTHTTSVVYTISIKNGRFRVTGRDEEDGTALRISQTRWDGASLHFTTEFPPTQHKAKHALKALSKKTMRHEVSGVYADGEVFCDQEIWQKKLPYRDKKR